MRQIKKRKKTVVSPETILQKQQKKDVSETLLSMGFTEVKGVDGKAVTYDAISTDFDGIFVLHNLIVVIERTILASVSDHLDKKSIVYNKVRDNGVYNFLDFLECTYSNFAPCLRSISAPYSKRQFKVLFLYCSKHDIPEIVKQKHLSTNVVFFEKNVLHYFLSLSKVIRRSAIWEFIDFLKIDSSTFGGALQGNTNLNDFVGHILPEECSSFEDGYKVFSFYIDAESIIRRAYVLRKGGWRNSENIGHYQRMILPKKIKSIRQYLNDKKRVFVNNIIATMSDNDITFLDKDGQTVSRKPDGQFDGLSDLKVTPASIRIENKPNIIGIIDGQHRVFSYHEGCDVYESKIAELRKVQNLLVTGILLPNRISEPERLKFEAELFLEINAAQTKISSKLNQEIELIVNPFSPISIAKKVLLSLNKKTAYNNIFEEYWPEDGKVKTASIISFGLAQLLKQKGNDSIFCLWDQDKQNSFQAVRDLSLLNEYCEFCAFIINEIAVCFQISVNNKDMWIPANKFNGGILTVTTINGILKCLRLLIENEKLVINSGQIKNKGDLISKLKSGGIATFNFRSYKSSQYSKMGEDIYKDFFAQ